MPIHLCPGRCGRIVPDHLYACVRCWRRLPHGLKRAIWDTHGELSADRVLALQKASDWYRTNPIDPVYRP